MSSYFWWEALGCWVLKIGESVIEDLLLYIELVVSYQFFFFGDFLSFYLDVTSTVAFLLSTFLGESCSKVVHFFFYIKILLLPNYKCGDHPAPKWCREFLRTCRVFPRRTPLCGHFAQVGCHLACPFVCTWSQSYWTPIDRSFGSQCLFLRRSRHSSRQWQLHNRSLERAMCCRVLNKD